MSYREQLYQNLLKVYDYLHDIVIVNKGSLCLLIVVVRIDSISWSKFTKSLSWPHLQLVIRTCKRWVQSSPSWNFTLIAQKSWQFNEFTVFFLISFVCSPRVKSQGLAQQLVPETLSTMTAVRVMLRQESGDLDILLFPRWWKWVCIQPLQISVMQFEYLAIIFSNLKISTFILVGIHCKANTNSKPSHC